MKKINKKLLYSLGAVPITVIPLATSFAMSTNTSTSRLADANFIVKFAARVNDSVDMTMTSELMNRFTQTNTYKNEHNWDNMDYNQLYSTMINIYQMPDENNGGFTMDEKITIAKYTIKENMYRNIFDTIGLPITKTTNQQSIEAASGKVQNPFESTPTRPQNFTIANQDIDLKGDTGHITSFEGLHPNEYMVNFSNQTILEYFLGTIAMSNEVTSLISSLSTWRNEIQNGNITFSNALNDFRGKVNALLSKYSTIDTTSEELISSSILNIFDIPQTQQNHIDLTSEELFRAVISGGIGGHLHPLDSQATIDDYITETDPDERLQKEAEIFNRIRTILRGFKTHDKINAMENVVDFSKPTNDYFVQAPLADKNANRVAIEKFAALLVKYSNDFHNDVEMRVSGNFLSGHALWIRSGHDNLSPWTKVDISELDIWSNQINEDPLKQTHVWRNLPQLGDANSAITNRIFYKYDSSSDLKDNLTSDDGRIMNSSNAKWYYTGIQVSSDNGSTWTDFAPRIHVYEADDSNDSTPKFSDWNSASVKDFILTESQIKLIESGSSPIKVRLTFYNNYNDKTPAETLAFSEYATFLGNYFKQKAAEARTIINNANHGSFPVDWNNTKYDPTAEHTFDVSVNSLNAFALYFNTGNDVHSVFDNDTYSYNFRVQNLKAFGQIRLHENTRIVQK